MSMSQKEVGFCAGSIVTLVDDWTLSNAQRSGWHQFGQARMPWMRQSLEPLDPFDLSQDPFGSPHQIFCTSYSPAWPSLSLESMFSAMLSHVLSFLRRLGPEEC